MEGNFSQMVSILQRKQIPKEAEATQTVKNNQVTYYFGFTQVCRDSLEIK